MNENFYDEQGQNLYILSECAVEVGLWSITYSYISYLYNYKRGTYDKMVKKIANLARSQNKERVLGEMSLNGLIY